MTGHDLEVNGILLHIDGSEKALDIISTGTRSYQIIEGGINYHVQITEQVAGSAEVSMLINGSKYKVKLKSKYADLLRGLGMDSVQAPKISQLKAPMPGLVLQVACTEADTVEKGQTLLILEAMKMENSIRASESVKIKQILVGPGDKVEKDQVLIVFEPS